MDDKPESETGENYKVIYHPDVMLNRDRGRGRIWSDHPHNPFNNVLKEIEDTLNGFRLLRDSEENLNADEIKRKLDKTIAKLENDIDKCLKSLKAQTVLYKADALKDVLKEIETMHSIGGYTYSPHANALRWYSEEEQAPAMKKTIAQHDYINEFASEFVDRLQNLLIPLISSFEAKKNEKKPIADMLEPKIHPIKLKNISPELLLIEKLLIIHYLSQHKLFPEFDSRNKQSRKSYQENLSMLIGDTFEAVKKAQQRMPDVIKGTGIVKENKEKRLENLNKVKKWFEDACLPDIVNEIDKLITKIKNP